jgi:DNA primase
MARIPQETIDRINATADIVDVVSKTVELKKRGRNFFGLCPFHDEKTPSFSVAPDKGIYHCFGCGKGGNAVNFIIENEKLSFVEAIQQLGQQLGIPVEFSGGGESKNLFDSLYNIHELAAGLYHKTLMSDRGAKALDYLKTRGISIESIKRFKVGFAPESSKFLFNAVKSEGFESETYEKSGLFGGSSSDFYDRFRSRIMFPIWNTSSKVVGFGGRVFASDDPAKYMNSPETPLYKKSDIFYGLHSARESIREKKYAILVEGYTDVIKLSQSGVHNCVAVSGTAFSDRHASQMKRFCSRVLLAYDGDTAGVAAAIKTGYALTRGGIESKIIQIPDKKDPDEWVSEIGGDGFIEKGVKKAIRLLDFQLLKSNFVNKSSSEKSAIVSDILSEVKEIDDPIISNAFIRKLADASGVEEQEIKRILPNKRNLKSVAPDKPQNSASSLTVNDKAAIGLIKVFMHGSNDNREWLKTNADSDNIENNRLKMLYEKIVTVDINEHSSIISHFDNEEDRRIITKMLVDDMSTIDLDQMSSECVDTLSQGNKKEQIQRYRQELKRLEAEGKETSELMVKILEIQRDMNE